MYKIFSLVTLALTISLTNWLVNCRGEFYPDWENCDESPQLEFIDFYLDHKPNTKHAINTLTFCVGKGKELPIGVVHIQLEGGNANRMMNETYLSLYGFRFINGIYDRCLQAGALEFTEPGDYNLTLKIYPKQGKSPQIGCLQANWTIHKQETLLE